jgi:hypothetical protein
MDNLGDCIDERGQAEQHPAEGWLCAPNGRPIIRMCELHATRTIEEYRAKLGEHWVFVPGDPPLVAEEARKILARTAEAPDRATAHIEQEFEAIR